MAQNQRVFAILSRDILCLFEDLKVVHDINFNKLKNIFVIIKKIDDSIKIILFYDGLLYNSSHFQFVENDYSGYTIVYKLDLKNKLFNHYLQ